MMSFKPGDRIEIMTDIRCEPKDAPTSPLLRLKHRIGTVIGPAPIPENVRRYLVAKPWQIQIDADEVESRIILEDEIGLLVEEQEEFGDEESNAEVEDDADPVDNDPDEGTDA